MKVYRRGDLMPRRTIDGIIDVMESLRKQGFEIRAPAKDVLKTISIIIGAKDSVRIRYVDLMQSWGFITKVESDAGLFFDLNFNAVLKYSGGL